MKGVKASAFVLLALAGCYQANDLTVPGDTTPPGRIFFTAISPASPSSSLTPTISGTAEADSTVRLYTNPAATGPVVGSGVATGGVFDIVATAAANVTTVFYATATDAAGNVSDVWVGYTYLNDSLAPTVPAGIVPTPGNRQVRLTWTASADVGTGVNSYDVAYALSGSPLPAPQMAGLVGTTVTITGLANCTAYDFGIRARDNVGNVSLYSGIITATPELPSPAGLVVVPGAGMAEVAWNAVPNATEYEVGYSSAPGAFAGTVVATLGKTALRLTGLPLNTMYFAVRAKDGASCTSPATLDVVVPLFAGLQLYQKDGAVAGDYFGTSVSTAGDVNGDGKADFIVGAYRADPGINGRVYVYSGADGSVLYQKNGAAAGDRFGFSVSTAGDVNGDGKADFIVGAIFTAPGGLINAGSAYVYSGADGSLLYQKDGAAAVDYFGYSVFTAGDVNGDGKADFIVGAYGADPGGLGNAGSAYVYSGADGSLLYQKNGAVADDEFGRSVATAGDVNTDGKADFIVGAIRTGPGGTAYVYSGADGSLLYQKNGASPGDQFGNSVATAGDVNGDGGADFIVGAPGANTAGSAYVYSGADGNLLYQKNGTVAGDDFGIAVSTAGDVNGDGRSDFIVGAYFARPGGLAFAGSAYVYSGADGSLLYQKNGAAAVDFFGQSVSTAGDVNGDGRADLIVGAPGADPGGLGEAGSAYVFITGEEAGILLSDLRDPLVEGASRTPSVVVGRTRQYAGSGGTGAYTWKLQTGNSASPAFSATGLYTAGASSGIYDTLRLTDGAGRQHDTRVVTLAHPAGYQKDGAVADNRLGTSVSTAGDVNGDGKADFIVGAPQTAAGGSAYVYSGADGSLLYQKNGVAAGYEFGVSVSTAGDVNGDGKADFIVGAPVAPPGGSAYVYSGADGSLLYQKDGAVAGDSFGYAVSTAGDVNGDGKADFIVGAYGADPGGSAYVYSGADGSLLHQKNGAVAGDIFGVSVATAGDVNGDGKADFIAGAEGTAPGGSAYVYSGADGSLLYQKDGAAAGNGFGRSVSTAGDVNGDGRGDFIVGAYAVASGGSAYVYSGLDGSLLYQKNGAAAGDLFGFSVSTAGDVNGDGRADFIVGAYAADPGGLADAGSAYVFVSIPPPVPLRRPTGMAGAVISSSQVDLTWTDNSSGETGFIVERRVPVGTWSTVGSAPANAVGFSVTGLVANTVFFFRVKALNASGDSFWSPEVTVITLP